MSRLCHVQVCDKGLRSWRERLVRYAKLGTCHRDEPSGSLHGPMRTRAFEQDDTHVFCRNGDVLGNVARSIEVLSRVYSDLGFPDHAVPLSVRPTSRAGSDEL